MFLEEPKNRPCAEEKHIQFSHEIASNILGFNLRQQNEILLHLKKIIIENRQENIEKLEIQLQDLKASFDDIR